MTYSDMLAGRGMKVGDQVACTYRIPFANQWWIHPFWIGVIEDAGTDKAEWNGHNTEAYYCVLVGAVKVRYLASGAMSGFSQHDSIANLRRMDFGSVAESPYFGDSQYSDLRAFSSRMGLMDSYPNRLQVVERNGFDGVAA